MKKLFLLILLSAISTNVVAEEYRTFRVVCDKTDAIIEQLKEKYKEIPIVAGKRLSSSQSTISVWGNPGTETFTILDTLGEMSCVLAVGTNITILLNEGEGI